MSFAKYPKYKDSGVAWLGEVPGHWEMKRLRYVATLNPSKSEIASASRDTEVSFLPMEAIGDDGTLNLDRTRPIRQVESGYTYFREGDVTLAKITPCFENGKGAVVRGLHGGCGFGTTELIVARPSEGKTTADYLHLLFTSHPFRQLGEAAMYGAGGQKRVPDDFVRDFAIAFPPLPEQTAIATFLDRETAKIDALVAEQQKLIALLQEKRQAVISHAVTKGLNPNAPMKDSGVQWLGEVPGHWEVVAFKRFVDIQNGTDHKHVEQDAGYPVIGSGGPFAFASDFLYDGESVLLGRKGTIDKPLYVSGKFWTVDTMYWTKIAADVCGRYAYYVALTIPFDYYATSTALPSMTKSTLSAHVVSRPPLPEQTAIATFLDYETAKLDTLMTEARTAITLLQERRSALISAAVTGQIDVRGLAAY